MLSVKWEPIYYSPKQFGVWRICFGLFLTFYYLRLFPYSVELYSNAGAFSDLTRSPMMDHRFFPKFLLNLDSPLVVQWIVGSCIACSIFITIGFGRKIAAFILWLLVCWLYNRNFYTDSPDYSFVNWLIFILIGIPQGEAYSLSSKKSRARNWEMPVLLYWGAWIILSIGYLCAGGNKIRYHDSAWADGSALYYVLTTDNTRMEWYKHFFDQIPVLFFWPLTWGILVLQIGAPFFVSFRSTRLPWWIAMTAMQILILFLIDLPEVSLGMLLFHAFLWDQRWMGRTKTFQSPVAIQGEV